MKALLSIILLIFAAGLTAQIDTSPEFNRLLDVMDMRLNRPLDSDYKTLVTTENDFLVDQLSIFSREEKLELRFHLTPEDSTDRLYQMPHIRTATLVMNLSSNDETNVTAVHTFDDDELATLNADWARMFTFTPKRGFSNKQHAQLVALYREGRGLAYTVLLFDKAPDTLEGRQMSLRFR